MVRKGMGSGQGKGYKNILGSDSRVHRLSAKGIKQPQKIKVINLKGNAVLEEEVTSKPNEMTIALTLRKANADDKKEHKERSFFVKEALKGVINITPTQKEHIYEILSTLPPTERKAYLKILNKLKKYDSVEEAKIALKYYKPELKKLAVVGGAVPLIVTFPELAGAILMGAGFVGGSTATGLTRRFGNYFDEYMTQYKKLSKQLPHLPVQDVRYLAEKSTIKAMKLGKGSFKVPEEMKR